MGTTLKLLGLFTALVAVILVIVGLFGSATETALRSVFEEPSSAALIVFIIFTALAMDLVLPLPSSVLSAGAVAGLGPELGVMIVWSGMTTGHFLGFLLGARYGAPAVNQIAGEETSVRLRELGNTVSMSAALALTRAVPVLSEACAVVAGASGMTASKFLFITATANFGVAMVYGMLVGSANSALPIMPVFAVSIAIPVVSYGFLRWIAALWR